MSGFIKISIILLLVCGFFVSSFETVSAQTSKKKKSRKTLIAKKKTVKKRTIPPSVAANPKLPYTLGLGQGNGDGFGTGSGRGVGSGNGIGSGNGTGSGEGQGNGTNSIPLPAPMPEVKCADGTISTPLKILRRPAPNYTQEARHNAVAGDVNLRVTFSGDGTISNVAPLQGLEYGLTERAVEAAQKMTFEPAIRCGVPYTLTKTVRYTFKLY